MSIDDLIRATYCKDVKQLNSLLAQGADINAGDEDGRTVLVHAVLDSEPDVAFIRYLLEQGADPDAADLGQRWTALHFAAQAGNSNVAKLLVSAGANVDAEDAFGNTPLWRAVMVPQPRISIIEVLLQAGADPMKRNRHGVSACDASRRRGMSDIERKLLSR